MIVKVILGLRFLLSKMGANSYLQNALYRFLNKLNIELPYDPVFPPFGIYQKNWKQISKPKFVHKRPQKLYS